jgi:hypothetical protein
MFGRFVAGSDNDADGDRDDEDEDPLLHAPARSARTATAATLRRNRFVVAGRNIVQVWEPSS